MNDHIQKNVVVLQNENFCKLVFDDFTMKIHNNEESSYNKNKFRKPKLDYWGPSKRKRFDDSKAGSVHKPSQHKQNKFDFSTASTPNYGLGKAYIPACA